MEAMEGESEKTDNDNLSEYSFSKIDKRISRITNKILRFNPIFQTYRRYDGK